jgi:hypothetical protein
MENWKAHHLGYGMVKRPQGIKIFPSAPGRSLPETFSHTFFFQKAGGELLGWIYYATHGSDYLINTLNLKGSQEKNRLLPFLDYGGLTTPSPCLCSSFPDVNSNGAHDYAIIFLPSFEKMSLWVKGDRTPKKCSFPIRAFPD